MKPNTGVSLAYPVLVSVYLKSFVFDLKSIIQLSIDEVLAVTFMVDAGLLHAVCGEDQGVSLNGFRLGCFPSGFTDLFSYAIVIDRRIY